MHPETPGPCGSSRATLVEVEQELDRLAARTDPTLIAEWEAEVAVRYRALRDSASFDPGSGEPDHAQLEQLLRLDRRSRDDREWVEGYRRGLADARLDLAVRSGPGVTRDPRDGWSAGKDRTEGYQAGLLDGAG